MNSKILELITERDWQSTETLLFTEHYILFSLFYLLKLNISPFLIFINRPNIRVVLNT